MRGLKSSMHKIFLVTIAAGMAVVLMAGCGNKVAFRSVVVNEKNGEVTVSGKDAYEGQHLEAGNDVVVAGASDLTLQIDSDKYLYAEENTHFSVDAADEEGGNHTTIHLISGAALARVDGVLGDNDSFEIASPISVMAVRGTVFRAVAYEENGTQYTLLQVFEGMVDMTEKHPNGIIGSTKSVYAGEEALIRLNGENSEFVDAENQPIDFTSLPGKTMDRLEKYKEDGRDIRLENSEDEEIGDGEDLDEGDADLDDMNSYVRTLYIAETPYDTGDTILVTAEVTENCISAAQAEELRTSGSLTVDNGATFTLEAEGSDEAFTATLDGERYLFEYDETGDCYLIFSMAEMEPYSILSNTQTLYIAEDATIEMSDLSGRDPSEYTFNMREFLRGNVDTTGVYYDSWNHGYDEQFIWGKAFIVDGEIQSFVQYYLE